MKILICGSRDYPDFAGVAMYLRATLRPGDVVISGMARGVDHVAATVAKQMGLTLIELPAVWKVDGVVDRSAGLKRNLAMLDQADKVVVFWDGHSRGTLHTLTNARKRGLPVEFFDASKPAKVAP